MAHWRRVALIVARRTGKRIGVDTTTRMLEWLLHPRTRPASPRRLRPDRLLRKVSQK